MKKETRFEVVHSEGSMLTATKTIFVDKETGVNYLYVQSGHSGGVTPLLDSEGKPVITK